MKRISIYITMRILIWLVFALAGTVLLFLVTQLLRVAPVFSGANPSFTEIATALGLLLIPVIGWALTPAFMVAVFATFSKMSADGELTALDAAGISRLRTATGPIVLAVLLTVLGSGFALVISPGANHLIRDLALDLAARALVGKIKPGHFAEPISGVTFYAKESNRDGSFKGVMIEDARDLDRVTQFVATAAKIQLESPLLTVQLKDGTAFWGLNQNRSDNPMAASFKTFCFEMSVASNAKQNLDFLPAMLAIPTNRLLKEAPKNIDTKQWSWALWRRIAFGAGFAALAGLSLLLSLGTHWKRRSWATITAAGVFLGYHMIGRLSESLMYLDYLTPIQAAFAPVAAVLVIVFFLSKVYTRLFTYRRSSNNK